MIWLIGDMVNWLFEIPSRHPLPHDYIVWFVHLKSAFV